MQLRYYQADAVAAIFDRYNRNHDGNTGVVMPTGTGKALTIAAFIQSVMTQWPNQRGMMITHDKRLIEQNANTLLKIWPNAPVGIYSAGLKSKQSANAIVYGGIASIAKNVASFGWRDFVIVDECHLISPDETTMYRKVFDALKEINPDLIVIGFTATPFRLKQGLLTNDGFFDDICYNISGVEPFNKLVEEGYLCTLVSKPMETQFDISNVKIVAGEFEKKSLENATDDEETRYRAIQELIYYGQNRNCWLVFENSIKHAEQTAAMINSFGISASAVHSKLPAKEIDSRVSAFKKGKLRALVNMGMLTTGFDHPPIDLMADLAHTMSPGRHVQKLGRCTRMYDFNNPGDVDPVAFPYIKYDCLVLDFARNIERLGPINDPTIPRGPGAGRGTGEAPIRICEACGVYNHASARICFHCGAEFKFETKFKETASVKEVVKKTEQPNIVLMNVNSVLYNLHEKIGSPPSIRVSYLCGLQTITEFVLLEHPGLMGRKARDWWRMRMNDEAPATTAEALRIVSKLKTPAQIEVWANKKPYPQIMNYYG